MGSIDTNYGALNSWAVFDPLNNANIKGSVSDLTVLPNGKVLAAGPCETASLAQGFCLYRWLAPGDTPDTSFGTSGVSFVIASASRVPPAKLLRRSDGRILLVSRCAGGLCAAAVNENGVGFDVSFGAGGQTLMPTPAGYTSVDLVDVALQADGMLLIGGTCLQSPSLFSSFCVTRLQTNGAFDPNFGVNNWAITTPGALDELKKINLLADGRFIATGVCGSTDTTRVICSVLASTNGAFQQTIQTHFGSNRWERVYDVGVKDAYMTILGASTNGVGGSWQIDAARREAYNAASAMDSAFGGTYPSTGFAGGFNLDSSNDGRSWAGKILRDGSLFYHGDCNNGTILCTTRFNPQGVLDSSYGVNGRYEYGTLNSPSGLGTASIQTITEADDGKVYVGGGCLIDGFDRPCVRRYLGGPSTVASRCSMDIDGDGFVSATTDGILLARAAAGMTGTSVTANAVSASAKRTTWAQIRTYLTEECGMSVRP